MMRSRMELPEPIEKPQHCGNCGHDHLGWEECQKCDCTELAISESCDEEE